MALDRDSDIPLGVQLGWALRARIADLAPGDRLPGVREVASSFGVNVNTARAAYARLEADGLIRVEHGRGTFVADRAPDDGRLAAVTRRALAVAQEAGLDPRVLAAALYAGGPGDPAPPADDAPAARRRALRAEIAALERELADAWLARALRDAAPATRPTGGRLLSEAELRAQRDELADRLATLDEPTAKPGAPPPARARASTRSATRPGVSWRPVFGSR